MAITTHSIIKEDGSALLVESMQEVEREFLVLASFQTTVVLESEASKSSAEAVYTESTSIQSTTPDVSIVLNDTGGSNDGDPLLMQGSSASSARTSDFRDDAVFPEDISKGVSAGPGFKTVVQDMADGSEMRIAKWQRPLRRYNVAPAVNNAEQLTKLLRFYKTVRGSLNGFRIRDPFDWSTAPDHVTTPDVTNYQHRHVIGAGDGTTKRYQLVKRYQVNETLERFRPITRPTHPTKSFQGGATTDHVFGLFVDGSAQTEGTHYTISRAGGEVEFQSAPTAGTTIEWCGSFDVPVRFDQEIDQGMLGDMETGEHYTMQPLSCTEINEGVHFSDHKWMGGLTQKTIAEDLQVYLGGGCTWFVTASSGGLKVFLPATDFLCDGGPFLTIKNASASNAFSVHKNTAGAFDAVVSSLAAGEHATFYITNAGEWLAIE